MKNLKKNKIAAEIAINTIVMMIIGLIIFGLGMGLFSKFYSSSEDQINKLEDKVKTDISSLECENDEWICSPSYKINLGESKTVQLYIANIGDEKINAKVVIGNDDTSNKIIISKNGCGELSINYLKGMFFNIDSGNSAQVPFIINTKKVSKKGCSFVTSAKLIDNSGKELGKTPIIVKII